MKKEFRIQESENKIKEKRETRRRGEKSDW